MKILITSGATREPIDRVRFITNMSSGRTGAELANTFMKMKHQVTYLHGEGAVLPNKKIPTYQFKGFQDLDEKIKHLLSTEKFDVIIHLAAVSDFSVEKIIQNGEEVDPQSLGKIESQRPLELRLRPNYKILSRIKSYVADYEPLVIGFKLTFTESEQDQEAAVEKLFEDGSVDLVVHNDLKQIEKQPGHQFHIYNIFQKMGTCEGPIDLASKLNSIIAEVI